MVTPLGILFETSIAMIIRPGRSPGSPSLTPQTRLELFSSACCSSPILVELLTCSLKGSSRGVLGDSESEIRAALEIKTTIEDMTTQARKNTAEFAALIREGKWTFSSGRWPFSSEKAPLSGLRVSHPERSPWRLGLEWTRSSPKAPFLSSEAFLESELELSFESSESGNIVIKKEMPKNKSVLLMEQYQIAGENRLSIPSCREEGKEGNKSENLPASVDGKYDKDKGHREPHYLGVEVGGWPLHRLLDGKDLSLNEALGVGQSPIQGEVEGLVVAALLHNQQVPELL
ncbi:hypothetical protein HWI79_1193 [Cryptosporidium felis]|nr:hypothetical protein HWI79_1193 [Cryptosporidium felis]